MKSILFIKYVHLITISSKYRGTFIFSRGIYTKLLFYKESNKRCKSLWKNVEPHSSTILEDEKLNSFLLERVWQVLQKIVFKEVNIVHLAT